MKILIVKIGAIGDVIQTAAAVELFRQNYDVDCIDWACGKVVAPLVKGFGVADRVFEVDERYLFGEKKRQLPYVLALMSKLASLRDKYNRVIIPQYDWRYRLLVSLVRARKKITPGRSAGDRVVASQRNRVYSVYQLLGGGEKPSLDISEALRTLGVRLLNRDIKLPSDLPDRFIALCPGGAQNLLRSDTLRRWPLVHYVELAEKLIADGQHVFLLGGPNDTWVVKSFRDLPIQSLIGKTNLVQMAKVLSLANAVVTHDSGPLHMTTMTDAGLVALFGPTPANAVVPFGRPRTVVLREENKVACSPCYDGRDYAECSAPICMQRISVKSVVDALRSVLVKSMESRG